MKKLYIMNIKKRYYVNGILNSLNGNFFLESQKNQFWRAIEIEEVLKCQNPSKKVTLNSVLKNWLK